jgi:hypothetical protein
VTKRHDSASGLRRAAAGTVRLARHTVAERVGVDEVRERELTVDLDRREQLAVARFERRVARDVDRLELEPELVMKRRDDLERSRAQAAIVRVIQRDTRYGYSPRVVVASATRCTASPYDAMRRLVA